MKTSHQSTKNCKYRTSEKYSNTYYINKQNINPACACHIYLINSTSVDTEMCCPKGKCGCQYFILLTLKKKKN
jgi:hypothetical protein